MRVFTVTVMILLLLGVPATGANPQKVAGHSCATIRFWVKVFGQDRAISWAKEKGYSQDQINAARRCLPSK